MECSRNDVRTEGPTEVEDGALRARAVGTMTVVEMTDGGMTVAKTTVTTSGPRRSVQSS